MKKEELADSGRDPQYNSPDQILVRDQEQGNSILPYHKQD